MTSQPLRLDFPGYSGASLAARLDLPNGPVRAYALFAHCFTCSKDLAAVRRIAAELAREGIALLRFDFTGLGSSEGEFSSTNFSSNVADLVSAADYLRRHYEAPSVLIGHSLGGAAVLSASKRVPETRAVVTIGAPADASHVLKHVLSSSDLSRIQDDGAADVRIGERTFKISRQFVEDVRREPLSHDISSLRKPLLIMHAPWDETVGIENATEIFLAAKHPKSFISLDQADHLLSDPADAAFAAQAMAGWLSRYVPADTPQEDDILGNVRVMEIGEGRFQNMVRAGRHRLFADEPTKMGGLDLGPTPYDFLSIALGACTSMTLRLYADHKNIPLGRVSVDVAHEKVHATDCADCAADVSPNGKIDRFTRIIAVDAEVTEELRAKIIEIANKCPVHRTLESVSVVSTSVDTFKELMRAQTQDPVRELAGNSSAPRV
ncbi:bifunctional alpha/beta hydrolase/OsmC family protein [Microvirga yunnanensis]|uniref:bifunctional alpha/beta hydrolase/OsmC family protein n=1 Tax=Microvirga yunnanensis TaxID=2953740 RepID=UPI0021C76861|nr:bifunctional alpha/beta hydrolase/OsmC family protein [Microvirga sp. HBU65207]